MAKQIGAATYIECSALQSENSVRDIFHVATLACVNKTNKNVKRNKSQRATKRISHMPGRPELSTVATDLRKDKAKSCTVMWRTLISWEKEEESGGGERVEAQWRYTANVVLNKGFNGDLTCWVRLYLGTEQREEMAPNKVASGNDTLKKIPKKKKIFFLKEKGKRLNVLRNERMSGENNTAKKRCHGQCLFLLLTLCSWMLPLWFH